MNESTMHYRNLIAPSECILTIVDCIFETGSIDVTDSTVLTDRLSAIVRITNIYNIPVILAKQEHSNISHSPLGDMVDLVKTITCTTTNPWEDAEFRDAVNASGRSRIIVLGRSLEICVTFAALSALEEGYDVYVVADLNFEQTMENRDTAISRMCQAGAVPVTTSQIIAEWNHIGLQ